MAQLYLAEYTKNLVGKVICIACREGILRDNLPDIVADIKFLSRHQIETCLFHNIPNRHANQKLIKDLEQKLPSTQIIRIPPDLDFYKGVFQAKEISFKLIFLERRYLLDRKGYKINTLTTSRIRQSFEEFSDFIANVNFRNAINCICENIEAGRCERIHILPAGKNSIKHELFTLEGSGTMIANNFVEVFRPIRSDDDVAAVNRILSMYKKAGFLKPRSKNYVDINRSRFFVTSIDGIIVGCVEQKFVDGQTVELGALAISTRFRSQQIGLYTVSAFIQEMGKAGYSRFISLTKNPRLQELLQRLGFSKETRSEYAKRQGDSPDVPMFFKRLS